MKKYFILGSILLLSITAFFYFGNWRLPFSKPVAYEFVPFNSPILVEWKSLTELETVLPSGLTENLGSLFLCNKFKEDFSTLNSFFDTNKYWNQLKKGHWIGAASSISATEWDFLYIVDEYGYNFSVDSFLLDSKLEHHSYQYLGKSVYKVEDSQGQTFYFSSYKGVMMMARFSIQIEDGLRQLDNPKNSILKQSSFKDVSIKPTINKVNLYFNFPYLPNLFNSFFIPEKRTSVEAFFKNLNWACFSLSSENNALYLTGKSSVASKDNFLLTAQDASNIELESISKVLPNNTAIYSCFNSDNFKKSNYFWKNILGNYLGTHWAYVITEPYSTDIGAEKFLAIHIKNAKALQKELLTKTSKSGVLNELSYQSFYLSKILDNNPLDNILEEKGFDNPYYSIINDYIVFSTSRPALEVWIDKYIANQTLATDAMYLKFKSDIKKEGNMSIYANSSYLLQWLQSFLQPEWQQGVADNYAAFSYLKHFSLHSKSPNGLEHLSAKIQLGGKMDKPTSLVWKTPLAASVVRKPYVLPTKDENTYSIWVQDSVNQLYVLNNSGEIIHKRRLNEPLLSDIFPIDYYGNGSLCYLFNTASKIYLVDEQAKDISAFPVNLQSPASNGVLVVDFDQSKEYNFFVACKNENIYGFDKAGRPLIGWNPKSSVGKISKPMQHFQYQGKDYLLALTSDCTLLCFKRDGGTRLTPHSIPEGNCTSLFFQSDDGLGRIVVGKSDGKVLVRNFSDEGFDLGFKIGNNENVKFSFENIVGDDRKDYLLLSSQFVACFSYNKSGTMENAFEVDLTTPQTDIFAVKVKGKKHLFPAVLNRKKKEIRLLESNGFTKKSFPLAGTTLFTIAPLFGENTNVLVVGYDNYIYTYRINL